MHGVPAALATSNPFATGSISKPGTKKMAKNKDHGKVSALQPKPMAKFGFVTVSKPKTHRFAMAAIGLLPGKCRR
jgi:hypothetical protein